MKRIFYFFIPAFIFLLSARTASALSNCATGQKWDVISQACVSEKAPDEGRFGIISDNALSTNSSSVGTGIGSMTSEAETNPNILSGNTSPSAVGASPSPSASSLPSNGNQHNLSGAGAPVSNRLGNTAGGTSPGSSSSGSR